MSCDRLNLAQTERPRMQDRKTSSSVRGPWGEMAIQSRSLVGLRRMMLRSSPSRLDMF